MAPAVTLKRKSSRSEKRLKRERGKVARMTRGGRKEFDPLYKTGKQRTGFVRMEKPPYYSRKK